MAFKETPRMKFENEFKKQMVPEWTDDYMDYNGLKRLLREISCQKQINKSKASFGHSKKKPKIDSKCSELASQPRNKDIENQVAGDIDKSRQHVSTQLKFRDISEIEVTFFRKLDEELNKVNSFYKENIEAVTEEASVLNKQMETLMALHTACPSGTWMLYLYEGQSMRYTELLMVSFIT